VEDDGVAEALDLAIASHRTNEAETR